MKLEEMSYKEAVDTRHKLRSDLLGCLYMREKKQKKQTQIETSKKRQIEKLRQKQ